MIIELSLPRYRASGTARSVRSKCPRFQGIPTGEAPGMAQGGGAAGLPSSLDASSPPSVKERRRARPEALIRPWPPSPARQPACATGGHRALALPPRAPSGGCRARADRGPVAGPACRASPEHPANPQASRTCSPAGNRRATGPAAHRLEPEGSKRHRWPIRKIGQATDTRSCLFTELPRRCRNSEPVWKLRSGVDRHPRGVRQRCRRQLRYQLLLRLAETPPVSAGGLQSGE